MHLFPLFDFVFVWPSYLILLGLILALVFGVAFYYKTNKNKDIRKSVLILLFVSRVLIIFILSIFLLEPVIRYTKLEKEKPILLLAIDNSQSMVLNKDSTWIKNELKKKIDFLCNQLNEKFEIKTYSFSNKLENDFKNSFTGKETDFSDIFTEIDNNYSNRNLGAILICSDGIFNKGVNPVYTNRDFKFPVYTLALGDTTENKDIGIKKINHNNIAYLGNQYPVEVIIQARKLNGFKGNIQISKNGKIIEQRAIEVSSNAWTQTVNFLFTADKPGIDRYSVIVSTANEENNKLNNSSFFAVEVIDSRDKVLILSSAPHPDIAAIKSAIESNNNYEVETCLMDQFSGSLKGYSLVICHSLPWNPTTKIKAELESKSIPHLIVSTNSSDQLPGLKFTGPSNKFNESDPSLNSSFGLFTLSEELRNYLGNFPPLKSPLGTYNISPEVNIFLSQKIGIVETENPMIYFCNNLPVKSGVVLGDGLWRWKLRDYAEHENFNLFNELINKSIQYLIVKEDKSFFRVNTKKIYNENEEVVFDAEVYNKSYELITEPDVTATIYDQRGKKYEYTFSKNQKTYRLSGIFFPPGEYQYEAKTKVNGISYTKKGNFTVIEIISERINQVANHQVLYNLSRQTKGKMYYKEEFELLTNDLIKKDEFKTISYEQKKLTDLIEFKWFFYALLSLIALEWFVRKRNGLY